MSGSELAIWTEIVVFIWPTYEVLDDKCVYSADFWGE